MHKEQLQDTLRRLYDELSQTQGVEPETLAHLRTLTRDMQQALEKREEETSKVESSATGLRSLLLKFEAEHPQLSATVGRVADALAAMGI
jgi:hypothetical protein